MSSVRPREGSRITVLVEVGGTPATHQARAGRVDRQSMIVPRRREDPRWQPDVGCRALVLFLHDGLLQAWSTRVEEVLPSSYYLTGVDDDVVADRRNFVRAELRLWVSAERVGPDAGLERLGQPAPALLEAEVDLSASGMRLAAPPEWPAGTKLAIWLGKHPGQPLVQALATVVRRLEGAALDCACEFDHLDSAGEDRLLRLVYEARERELGDRLQKRR